MSLSDMSNKITNIQEDYATKPVPKNKRRSAFGTLVVWAGWTISVTGLIVGGTIGAGLPLRAAIPAILLGNLVLAVVGSLNGYIGMKTGLSTYMLAQSLFGKSGSVIISVFIGIMAMGFVGVFAGLTGGFINSQIASIPAIVGALAFTVLVVATAIHGFRGLETLSKIAVPALWVFAIVGLLAVGSQVAGGLTGIFNISPSGASLTIAGAMTLAIATWIAGATITADIGRYAQNRDHVLLGAFGGWIAGAAFLECVAAALALGVGDGNLVVVMGSMGSLFALLAFLVFVLAMWTSGDNNLYSFSLAFASLSNVVGGSLKNVTKESWVIVGGAIVFILAALGIYGQFVPFLLLIAITVPPVAGIFISHFYVLGNIDKKVKAGAEGINTTAFASWILASGFGYLSVPGTFPGQGQISIAALSSVPLPITTLVLAMVLYAVLNRVTA